jgi:hypothetical protein
MRRAFFDKFAHGGNSSIPLHTSLPLQAIEAECNRNSVLHRTPCRQGGRNPSRVVGSARRNPRTVRFLRALEPLSSRLASDPLSHGERPLISPCRRASHNIARTRHIHFSSRLCSFLRGTDHAAFLGDIGCTFSCFVLIRNRHVVQGQAARDWPIRKALFRVLNPHLVLREV